MRARLEKTISGLLASIAAAVSLAALVPACGPVTKLEPSAPDKTGFRHDQYRIDCIEMADCKKRAVAACKGPHYEVVSEWKNPIPESELPGLNEQSRPKDARDWDRAYLPNKTGIESREPMRLSQIVVACSG